MRPNLNSKQSRRAHIAAGVLTLMVPTCAYALTEGSTPAFAGLSRTAPAKLRAPTRLTVKPRAINALGGETVHVRGHLLPALAGRVIHLEGRFGGQWRKLGSARTGRHGGFNIRYGTLGTGQHRLRVVFEGDGGTRLAKAQAGMLTVYTPVVASWYEDGGSTACGFHAYYGVANKTLPCGTKVSFSYHGRSVTATVDDRGPYIAGRDFDLNQNTAGALGFGGVDTVWSSIS